VVWHLGVGEMYGLEREQKRHGRDDRYLGDERPETSHRIRLRGTTRSQWGYWHSRDGKSRYSV
jgi:hypothetical protein